MFLSPGAGLQIPTEPNSHGAAYGSNSDALLRSGQIRQPADDSDHLTMPTAPHNIQAATIRRLEGILGCVSCETVLTL